MGLINAISPALHSRAHALKHEVKAALGIPSNHRELSPVSKVISPAERMDSISRYALLDAHVERAPVAYQATAPAFFARKAIEESTKETPFVLAV